MPSIESEVWCINCGDVLNTSEVNGGIEITICERCLDDAKQEIRDELEGKIEDLESQVIDLQEQLDSLS